MKRCFVVFAICLFLNCLVTSPKLAAYAIGNLSTGKLPSSSVAFEDISRITDGDKNTSMYSTTSYTGLQWIQIDLGSSCNVNDVKLWHYYGDTRSYHDVIVQLSNDSTFSTGITTVFNNDTDNSSGLGTGPDSEYTETISGKDISFNTLKARYVRFYTNGNTVNLYNHYVEAEVYGDPAPSADSVNLSAGIIPTSSASFGNISRITDGDKNTFLYSTTSRKGLQWIQIDLGSSSSVNDIKLWHYYGDTRSYHDVIVQLSNNSTFSTGVTTVFNNDTDNSSGLGVGSDSEYIETSTGKDISFNTLKARYVRFYTNGNTINLYNHYVEVEVYGNRAISKLLFTFDDGLKDVITTAAPILKAKGFNGTAYVVKSYALNLSGGNSIYMNVSDLDNLYNNYGWDISNHTNTHQSGIGTKTNSTSLSTLKNEYLTTQEWLISNGWTRGAYHAAYPYGEYSTQLIDILKGIGVKTARHAWGGIEPMPVSNYYLLLAQDVENSTVSTVKSQIDKAVTSGSTIILMIHGVNNSGDVYTITTQDFQSIVDYVEKYALDGKIQVNTISEWYDSAIQN